MFGTKEECDPIRYLIGSAMAWGGNPEKAAIYLNVTPKKNDGTIYLFAYFLDIFWLDLGEVLYVLDRANSVIEAFTPLESVAVVGGGVEGWLCAASIGGRFTGAFRDVWAAARRGAQTAMTAQSAIRAT